MGQNSIFLEKLFYCATARSTTSTKIVQMLKHWAEDMLAKRRDWSRRERQLRVDWSVKAEAADVTATLIKP
jgi:hypothetical protein